MNPQQLEKWQHSHNYQTDSRKSEKRTRQVVLLTISMMVIEIGAGIAFGSMALLADGWHMATHAFALGITLFAYSYARRHTENPLFTFGTGKVGALGGYTSAIVLAIVAMLMAFESVQRLMNPVNIQFDEAILVAIIGLLVNIASAFLLQDEHHHHHRGHDAPHSHSLHHDHNLRAAYFHVLADALTSLLAIFALLAGKMLGWTWMDPAMGVVGALVITKWAYNLLGDASAILLDKGVSQKRQQDIKSAIEVEEDCLVSDLHVWPLGSHHFAAIISIVASQPKSPDHYKDLLDRFDEIEHITIEIHAAL